jgi:hypothetical protein
MESSGNQLITDAINAHGIFFKKAVRDALEKIQGVQILGEEYPVPHLEGGALDLLIDFVGRYGRPEYVIPIECKRGYTAVKRWIFFEDPQTDVKLFYTLSKSDYKSSNADYLAAAGLPICMEGVELDLIKLKNDARKAASPDSIHKAAFQVCKGFTGFLIKEIQSRQAVKDDTTIQFSTITAFPLLITTAPLSICKFSHEAIDILTGNHQGEIETEDVPWLILKYPFTPSSTYIGETHLSIVREGYATTRARGYDFKEGIIVINPSALPQLFEVLSNMRFDPPSH